MTALDAKLLRAALRRPPFLVAAAVFLALCLLTLSPLVRQPGWELATALGLALAFFGGLPARAVVGAARELGRTERTPVVVCALLLTLVLPLPAILLAVLASLVTTPCNPLAGIGFVGIIVPSAALVAGAVGLGCAVATLRMRGFLGLYLLLVVLSAVATVTPIVAGPQIFAFNVFAGYFPGPLYDESLHLTDALLWSRIEALLWASAALLLAVRVEVGTLRLKRSRAMAWALVPLGLVALIELHAGQLGLRTSYRDLDQLLGGLRVTQHFRIHYPRERSAHDVELLARDLEFRYLQDSQFLGVESARPIDAFYYRSPEEKQRWVGAAQTDFAKPWLHEFHLQFEGFPDRVAKHELAHVLAGELGSGPFKVCAWAGLVPNPGIVEGLATAADNPADELTLPEWSHAMRELHLAPELRTLLRPTGFIGAPANRAYTLAGAFLRYLVERYGKERLRVLYPHGDFEAAYGKGLDVLVGEWEAAIDAVPLDAHARHVAERRFSQPSLFGKACAREEARLREELGGVPAAELPRAIALTERLLSLSPEDLGLLRDLANRQRDAEDLVGARTTLERLLATPKLPAAQESDARALLADLDAQQGQLEAAKAGYARVVALQPEQAPLRSAEIHLAALEVPGAIEPLLTYFRSPHRDDALLGLHELAVAKPSFAPARYLIGRRLTDAHLHAHALGYLPPAVVDALDALPATHAEALKLRARDAVLLHRCDDARKAQAALAAATPADRAFFADWLARCDFEVAEQWPVVADPL